MEFCFNNVNDAFHGLVRAFHEKTIVLATRDSRAGKVMECLEPVTVGYRLPRERVLLNKSRDANPFFHLFEALWMLAGRNDVAPLKFYNSKIGEIASDDGLTFNGAYGYRWRWGGNLWLWDKLPGGKAGGKFDQLSAIIHHLRDKPNSRRAVLQMWNVEDDLQRVDNSKDVCCNTAAYFNVVGKELHMTVTNRSNDMIWGMLGANYVHFTMLQEYMANCLGLELGNYYQFSNNLHVYLDNWKPVEWLRSYSNGEISDYTQLGNAKGCRLVQDKDTFDQEVQEFVTSPAQEFTEPFLETVAKPMCLAFASHKQRNYARALDWLSMVESDDWHMAGTVWINKRLKNYSNS